MTHEKPAVKNGWILNRFYKSLMLCFVMIGTTQSLTAQVDVTGSNPLSNGTYASLDAAFIAINTQLQAGNSILISITADHTMAGGTSLNENASPWNSLTINPVGTRIITGSYTSSLIQLYGADNVTINGLNTGGNSLTIKNTSTSTNSSVIGLVNDAQNNLITNCTLLGSSGGNAATFGSTASGAVVFIGYSKTGGVGNDNITISNNTFGANGSNYPSCAIRGYNSNTTNAWSAANDNISISGNNIADYFSASTYSSSGIYIGRFNTNWNIQNNKFYQSASRTQTTGNKHTAIFISTNHDGTSVQTSSLYISSFTIQNNVFGFANSSSTGTYSIVGTSNTIVEMIYLCVGDYNSSCLTSIQGNTFANISLTGSAAGTGTSAPLKMINIYKGNVDIGTTSGNTFGDQTSTGSINFQTNTTSVSNIYGILADMISTGGTVNVANNTFGSITSQNNNATPTSASIYVIASGSTNNTPVFSVTGNTVGGTVANSIQNLSNVGSTNTTNCVIGIYINAMPGKVEENTIRNMSVLAGTGTGSGVNPASATSSMIGIAARAAYATTILHNTIYSLNNMHATQAVNVVGIEYTNGASGSYVKRNFVRSLGVASVSAVLLGINISNTSAGSNFENNMISLGKLEDGTDITVGCVIYGIYERTATTQTNNFYFNSIQIAGDNVSGSLKTYAFYSEKGTIVKAIVNNIFFNKRNNGAGTGNHYAIRILNTSSLTIDYNDYQVTGNGGVLGRINTTDYATLGAWQGATGQDVNTIPSFTPLFISDNDLHLQTIGNNALVNGLSIGSIPIDIDADPRQPLPTIGADEIVVVVNLPVTIIDLMAHCQTRKVIISWTTLTEKDNAYFSIERSLDGVHFEVIGMIDGAGSSLVPIDYLFTDNYPNLTNENYYRLKQHDYNGVSMLTPIILGDCQTNELTDVLISPNPGNGLFVVESNEKIVYYEVYNQMGELIFAANEKTETFLLDLNDYSEGVYLIRMVSISGKTSTEKVIKL